MVTMGDPLEEIPLLGGEVNDVVRVGATVRRTAGSWTPSVQAVLAHLGDVGFGYAPVPLGIDDRGREVVSYLDGTTARRPWPAVLRTDAGLHQLGRMAVELAVALRSYPVSEHDIWRHGGVPGGPHPTLRHGDLGLWNTLWATEPAGSALVGVIDWDYLEPAPELWDLAQLAYYAVPLRPRFWAESGFAAEPDYTHRLAVLADYADVRPADLVDVLLDLQALDRERAATWGGEGLHPWDKFLAAGFVSDLDQDGAWLRSRRW